MKILQEKQKLIEQEKDKLQQEKDKIKENTINTILKMVENGIDINIISQVMNVSIAEIKNMINGD